MGKTKIEWCDTTWNPVTGCLHDCPYCYARRIARRFGKQADETGENQRTNNAKKLHGTPYPWGFDPTMHFNRLDDPKKQKKSKRIFVCSMADLFGNWVPNTWIDAVMQTVRECPQHMFMFLTKNPKRYNPESKLPENALYGTTITSRDNLDRIGMLPLTKKTFLSIEPLKGEINLGTCDGWEFFVGWVIIGAETGTGAKPPKKEWVQKIIDQCREKNIPVFLKDNLNWHEIIQEFPKFHFEDSLTPRFFYDEVRK